MKIFEVRFTDAEWAAIHALAGATLMNDCVGREEAVEIISNLTPPNVLRLVVGLPERSRGGARPNNGRRNCARCQRIWSAKVKAVGQGLCADCWNAQE